MEEQIRKKIRILAESYVAKANDDRRELLEIRLLKRQVRMLVESNIKVSSKVPRKSTGINLLVDVLKRVVPIIEDGYKLLTTSKDQRISYRSHILNSTINAIQTPRALQKAEIKMLLGKEAYENMAPLLLNNESSLEHEGATEEDLQEDEDFSSVTDAPVDLEEIPDEEKFLDIKGDSENQDVAVGANDVDNTGRNIALDTFPKIEKVIIDSYNFLSNDEDRQIYFEYLLTNMKLYFDKFEDEIQDFVKEPSTQSYKDQKVELDGAFDNVEVEDAPEVGAASAMG